ncbi:MAG TPA: hypothetical protein VGR02_01015, partial [Thermoanaerobaculia bacterium]|nr:hypothetical protein [Thermoanaerobaculia bacterium]
MNDEQHRGLNPFIVHPYSFIVLKRLVRRRKREPDPLPQNGRASSAQLVADLLPRVAAAEVRQ